MEHTIPIYFSDLTFEKQDEIREQITQWIKDDQDEMEEIKGLAESQISDDEEPLTKKNIDWHIQNIIEDKVEDIIGREFNGSATMEY